MKISFTRFKLLKLMLTLTSAALILNSCSPAALDVTTLTGSGGSFSVNQSIMSFSARDSMTSFNVSGSCSPIVNVLQLSFDEGATYISAEPYTTSYTMNCLSSGTYSMTIDPTSHSGFIVPLDRNYKHIVFRGTGDFGHTQAHNITLQITPGENTLGITNTVSASAVVSISGVDTTVILSGKLTQSVSQTTNGFSFNGGIKLK